MTTWQAMHRLEQLGYTFTMTEEGKVQARPQGQKPAEATALLDIARADRDAAVGYVRERLSGATVHAVEREVSLLEALAVGMAWKTGEAEVFGRVRLSRGHIFISWGGAVLPEWIDKARGWAMEQLAQMEECDYWALPAEEREALCARFNLCHEMLGMNLDPEETPGPIH